MSEGGEDWKSVLARALHDEALGFAAARGAVPHDDHELLREYLADRGAALTGAMLGAATRFVRAHPEADDDLRNLASLADEVEKTLPTSVRGLWQTHYANGHSLAVCGAMAGLDRAPMESTYRDLVRALCTLVQHVAQERPPESMTFAVEFDEGVTARIDALAASYRIDREEMVTRILGSGIAELERARGHATSGKRAP